MSDDLVKRLRETTYMYQVDCELKMTCADRIEQLAATCEELEANINLKADFIDATINQLAGQDQRIEELEVKLAKAVKALEWVKFGGGPNGESCYLNACATLAEIKGDSHAK